MGSSELAMADFYADLTGRFALNTIFADAAVVGGILLRPGPLIPKDIPSQASGAVTTAQANASRERVR